MGSFSESERAAWGGFLRAYATIDRAIDADLRRHEGLRHADFEVLLRLRLAPNGRLRIQDLASSSLLTRSGISRVVDRLTRMGLVHRQTADEDGRGTYAVITTEGRRVFDALEGRHVAVVRAHFHERLTPEEQGVLARAFAKINDPRDP